MGTFCTTTSLAILMVDTNFDTATTSLATDSIIDAENKIREILSKRYDVSSDEFQTSTSTPPVVQTLCKWLTAGYMYEDLSRGGNDAFNRADRYIDKAMSNLNSIADGTTNVVDSLGSELIEDTSAYQVLSNTSDYNDTFDEGDPLNWEVDPTKLSDIESSKT
jgi:hypothetical protein